MPSLKPIPPKLIGIKRLITAILFTTKIKNIEGNKLRHFSSAFIGNSDGPFNLQEDELESIDAYTINEIKRLLKTNPELFTEGLKLELKVLFEFLKK